MVEQLDPPLMIEQHDRIDCSVEDRLKLAFQPVGPLLLKLRDSQ